MTTMKVLINELVGLDIDFDFRTTNHYQFVYVHGFKNESGYRPEIRISVHSEGGYYVKNCGIVTENASIDDVIEAIGEMICFDK